MARKIRIEYPGALYHVMNRGDRREAIFKDDSDRRCFLETLGQACAKTDWEVQAYGLMGNHFHLVVETPQANLVAGRKWLLGTYTLKMSGRMGEHHYGEERRESAEEKAERVVLEELTKRGWGPDELASRAKGDAEKVAVAMRLRRETTMTLKWISQRLQMGAWTHLNKRLHEENQGERRART